MNTIKDFVFRFGFAIVGAFIGYLLADTTGLGAGIGIGLFIPVFWHAYQDGLALQNDADSDNSHSGKWHEHPFGTRLALYSLLGYGALLVLYAIIIAGRHESRAMLEWFREFQPAIDWYSTFIPAFNHVASDLSRRGRSDWIPAVQHLLFVTWLFLPLFVFWFALDFLLTNRRHWSQPQWRFLARTSVRIVGRIWLGMFCALGVALLLSGFLFGFGTGGGRKFSAIDAIWFPMTALGGFLFTIVAVIGLWCVIIAMRSQPNDVDIKVDKELASRIAAIESLFRRPKRQ